MKKYQPCFWEPQSDISIHELALCMGTLLCAVAGNLEMIEESLEAMPPNAKRHFRRTDSLSRE